MLEQLGLLDGNVATVGSEVEQAVQVDSA